MDRQIVAPLFLLGGSELQLEAAIGFKGGKQFIYRLIESGRWQKRAVNIVAPILVTLLHVLPEALACFVQLTQCQQQALGG